MKTKLAALVTWNSTDLSRDQAVAVAAWKHAASVISAGQHRLVLLDEITYPITWGWLEDTAVVDAITSRPPSVNVVDAALINAVRRSPFPVGSLSGPGGAGCGG
jgi:ATP:corrinoid adenosyltransferase